MIVHLPEEMKQWESELQLFFEIMVWKLHLNRHKGFIWSEKSLDDLLAQLKNEFDELIGALESQSQFQIGVECADVANQAFLLALRILYQTRKEFEDDRIKRTKTT